MPEYIVEDDAGNTLVLEGDSPPTEQELRELFASRSSAPPTHPLVEYMKVPAPTSLEPESQFGFPESFKPPPTEYVQETPKIGAAPPTGVFDDLSRMLGGGMGMTYEEREQARAQGVPVPQTVKSFFTKPPPDIIPKMPTVGEAPPGTVEKIAATAISPLGALAFGPDVPAQVARETYNVAAGLPEFMMSRLGVATALAGAGPRLAVAAIPRAAAPALTSAKWTARGLRNVSPRAVAGGFAADMTKSALEQDEYIQQNWDKMSVPERARALTGLGSTLAMGGALGFHAVGPYTAAMAKAPAPPPRLKARFFAPEAGPARETSRVFYGQEEGPPVTVMAPAQPPAPASRLPLISKPEASVQGRDGVLGIMDRYKVSWDEAVAMQSRARRLYGISKEPAAAAPAPAPTPTTTPTTAPTPTGEVTEGQRRYMEAAKRRARVMFEDEEVEIPLLTRDEVKGGVQMVMERYGVDEATANQLIRTSRSVYEVRDLSPEERAHVEAELGTVDVPVRVVEEGEPADPNVPFARRLRRQFMGFNRRTGEIEIYAKEFKEEISRIPESKRAQWVHSRLNEEQWHAWVWRAIGDSGTATYWNSMSWIEQALAHRFYTGRWLVEGTTPEFRGLTASELGHEVIRRRMQRLAGLTPGEILESAFTERWTIRSLEAIENAINAARETFGTRASQEQLRLVDRIHKHVNMVKSALVAKQQVQPDEEQGGPAATGRAEFRVRRLEGTEEDITRRIEALRTMTADEFSADVRTKVGALTGEAYRLGLSVTTREQLDFLKRSQKEAYDRGKEMANRGDPMGGMQEIMRGQFFREAYEIATGTGSAGYSLRTGSTIAETPIPFQMEEAAEGPGAVGRPDYSRPPENEGEALTTINNAFAYLRTRAREGASDIEIKAEIDRLLDYEAAMSGLVGFPKGFVQSVHRRTDQVLSWYDTYDQEAFPAAAGRRREKKVPKEQQELGLGVPVVPPSKGPISKVGEEAMELQKMRIAAAQGEMMPATGAATLRQRTAFVEVTPKALDDFVKDYLNEAVIKTRAKTVPGTKEEGGFRVREKTPFGFKHFANAVRFKFGPVPNEQLREVFADNVGEALMNATGERLVQILKAMKLVKNVIGGGKPGERRLAGMSEAPSVLTGKKSVAAAEATERLKGMGVEKVTPPMGVAAGQPRQLMMPIAWDKGPVEISKALERAIERKGAPTPKAEKAGLKLRYRAIAEIMHNLFTEAESLRLPLKRERVFPEELGSPLRAREPVFRSISGRELGDPKRLGEMLTSDASVSSYPGFESGKVPRSITKRLVALLDRQNNEIVLSDIYMDYRKISPVAVGRERVAVVRMGNTHVPLESLLKRYRPIFSILLDDPVHNFSRRYRSISEFHREFGYEAQERMRAMEEPSEGIEPGEEGYETSGTLKRPEFQEGRGMIESNVERPITDAEAMAAYDFVTEEIKGINSPEDVRLAVEGFADMMTRPIEQRPLRAMSAFYKMMRHVMEKNPDMTEGDALYSIARFLYENNKAAGSRQQLIQRTLANYGGEFPRTDVPVDPITEARAGVIRGREAISEQQAVRRAQWLAERGFPPDVEAPKFLFEGAPERPEGISREVVAPERGPIEGVGAGLKGTMARGTEARLSAAEKAAQQGAEAIAEEARKENVDDSYFDRMLKASSAAEREAIAELEGQIPKREGETTEQWLERVREYAERLEEYKAAQQGAFSEEIGPAAIGRYALPVGKTIADLVGKTVGAGIRIGSEWMVDRLRRVVPPTATITHQHLDKANEIISKSQEHAGDMFYRFGDDVIRESGRTNKATSWMNGFQVIEAGRSAIINSKEAIEGRLQPPAYALDITAKGQEGNYLIGQFIEPVSPGFIANGGMHNNLTAFGYDVIRDGPGTKNWNNIVRGQVIANPGVSARDVTNLLLKYKKVLDDPAADPAALFAINQDFSRALPRTVTHIWTGSKRFGHWEPIIHSDLFNYFNHGIRRTAMIRAFREEYPIRQRGVAQPPSFNLVIDQMRREVAPKYHNLINTLYRTLQGHPSENLVQTGWLSEAALARTPSITQPAGVALRVLQPIGETLRTMLLSQQILLQPGELLSGASSTFFGFRRSWMATIRYQEMFARLEMLGMLDKILYNNAWQPNAPIRSAFRIMNNNARRWTGQNLFNELQEAQAAGAAYITAQRIMMASMIDIATGKPMVRLTWSERNLMPQTFRVMGFTEAEVKSMMKGDPRLLGQMVRKAASFASGGHMHPSEQSRFLANRAARAFLWFQRYPATRANQFVKLWQVMTEHALAGRKTEARNAGLLLVKFAGVATNQGLLQTALMTAFYGGAFGLVLKLNEMLDSPFAFFFDMWRSAIGGPFQFITRGWEDSGLHGVANNFKRVAVPFNVAGELWEVSAGAGAYKDMELSRRIGKFLQREIPLSKAAKLGVATFGLSLDDPKLDASVAALGKWKRKKFGFEDTESFWKEDEGKTLRIEMKKAVEALKDGDTEAYLTARREAVRLKLEQGKLESEAVQDVNQSFLARRLLYNPQTRAALTPEELDELESRIGSDALQRLQDFDKMLEEVAGKKSEP